MGKFDWDKAAAPLIRVIDLTILAFKTHPRPKVSEKTYANRIDILEQYKQILRHPISRSQKGVRELEHDLLCYFNEASGEDVDFFWARVKEEGLRFEKKDNANRLAAILKKNRLNFDEYRYLLEDVIPFREKKAIDDATLARLNKLLLKYEMAGKKS